MSTSLHAILFSPPPPLPSPVVKPVEFNGLRVFMHSFLEFSVLGGSVSLPGQLPALGDVSLKQLGLHTHTHTHHDTP